MFKKKKIAWFICQLVKMVARAFLNVTSDDSVHTSVLLFYPKKCFAYFVTVKKGRAEVAPALPRSAPPLVK